MHQMEQEDSSGYVSSQQLEFHTQHFSKSGNWKWHANKGQKNCSSFIAGLQCTYSLGPRKQHASPCYLWEELEYIFSWVSISSAYAFKTIGSKSSVDVPHFCSASSLLCDLPRSALKHEDLPEFDAYHQKKKRQIKSL